MHDQPHVRFYNAVVENLFFFHATSRVLNVADAICYIFNTVLAWKLKHNKDSRHVNAITDSQTVQTQVYTDTLGRKTSLHPKTMA